MPKLRSLLPGPRSSVAVLVVSALGAFVFTAVIGMIVYRNTQRLISAANRVQHTHEVLSALQRASQLSERIEYSTRLYTLDHDDDNINRARTAANTLSTTADRIRVLVSDNPQQLDAVENLQKSAVDLSRILDAFTARSTVPDIQIQYCKKTISLMSDREQWLLKERSEGSHTSSITSVMGEILFVGLSLITSMILFGFLVRDARQRQRSEERALLANQELARSVAALEDSAREAALLTAARDELQLCVEVGQVYRSAARSFSRLLPRSAGCLCMINNSRQLVEVVSRWGETSIDDFNPPEACCGLRSGQPRWRQPGFSEIHCTHFADDPPQRYLCHPIVANGNTLGILYIQCAGDEVLQSVNQRIDALRHLVQITGMAVATLNLRTTLENQSIRDSLTGLFNRHFMHISLERELGRASRRNQVLAVLMLDVDHFKAFNDAHGHAAGDAALVSIADIFLKSTRAEDIACRYGGEEFTIMLPDMTIESAEMRAQSIRRAVANLRINSGREELDGFSISIGVSLYPQDGETADILLRKADLALYRAKREGRNRVMIFNPELATVPVA